MKDGAPFGLAGISENWKEPTSGEWLRTFAIITTEANDLVADRSFWRRLTVRAGWARSPTRAT